MPPRARSGAIRLLVVDDHPVTRTGLKMCLGIRPEFTIAGEAEDGESALRLAKKLKPDVVLLDVAMPGLSGIDAAERLRAASPSSRVLFLSMHADREYVRRMARSGAKGYVLKDAPAEELARAIRAVHAGRTYFSPAVADALLDDVVSGGGRVSETERTRLSRREIEVLRLVVEGLRSREIAQRLGISPRTVETHREHIMDKLGVRTLAGLVRYAIEKGIVPGS